MDPLVIVAKLQKIIRDNLQRVGKQLGGMLAGQLGAAARPVRGLYQKGKKVASNVYKKGGKA